MASSQQPPAFGASQITAGNLSRERAALANEAEDIAAAAARFAADVAGGITTGAHRRLAQDVQQFALRAARYEGTQETATLYDAEAQ
jgi:hypothetical protein